MSLFLAGLALLLACSDDPEQGTDSSSPPDTDTVPSDSSTHEQPTPQRWHALLSADHKTSKQHPPLVEVGSDLIRTWEQDFNGERGRGAQGIDRAADGRTVYTRIDGDVESGWIDLLDASGERIWSWDGDGAGGLHFPHAVVFTPAGDLIVADTSASRLLSVDLTGQVLWEEPLPTTSPNGLDLWTAADGTAHLLVTGRSTTSADSPASDELISRYVLGERTASPEPLWSRVLNSGVNAGESPHGPALLDDGTVLYCARGRGQVVHLDAEGEELWRSPEDSDVLSQPQDVVVVDEAWLVVDTSAGALLRIEDPFGALTLTDSTPLEGIFGVTLVWCGEDGGLPCLGP